MFLKQKKYWACPIVFTLILFCLPFFSTASFLDRDLHISGETMGTYYHITLVSKKGLDKNRLKTKIDAQLEMINKSMSCFDPDSEISVFNRAAPHMMVKVSRDFITVMKKGRDIYSITSGAWDATIKPLVDLWGFGTEKGVTAVPGQEKISELLSLTGFDKIEISDKGLMKKNQFLSLDLGSIAKGYGVDKTAELLKQCKIENFLVEIGGEIYAAGKNKKESPWQVGISTPKKGIAANDLYKIVSLKDKALATSGDYRNFIRINGKTYAHIINPVTGYPPENQVVSASVIAGDCTFADGLATALMVMAPEKGTALVNGLSDTECMIIVRESQNKFKNFMSKGFSDYLQ
ncbi:MAG: FAD:protein FMN transferase [Desulfobacteraceae bacterium]